MGLDWHFGFMSQSPSWTNYRKIYTKEFSSSAIPNLYPLEEKWNRVFLKNLLKDPESFLTHTQQ